MISENDLQKHVIITKATIKKILGWSDAYAYTVLTRLQASGRVKKIIKGKYSAKDDVYLIATNLYSPCYLSFLACSYFKGYTEQIINTVQIVTSKQARPINFENYKITIHKTSKDMFFGYTKMKYGNFFVFLAEDEKLIIDALNHEKLMGNFDEIIKIFKAVSLDIDKLVMYLKNISNRSLNKKVGFLTERFRQVDISDRIDYKDRNTVQLSNLMKGKKIDQKWQVKHAL